MSLRYGTKFVAEEDYPVVETKAGKYLGYIDDDVFTFKGMKYADAGRFQMPQAPAHFDGVRDAYNYGFGCPEMTYNLKGKFPGDELQQIGMYWNMDENVQYLNVWTKSLEKDAKKPVFFFIHGGGFAGGAANHLFIYEGWALANLYDCVVVSINHRLNMLGYLDLSAFGEKYKNSGNLGQADIVAALQWVKENITGFGGDPDNVTLVGQSGGGGKISTLLQMPAADGLYHKVVIQSGVMGSGSGPQRGVGLGEETVRVLGLPADDISEIETMDYDKLSAAVQQAAANLGFNGIQAWAPKADGEYYLGDPRAVGFRPETKNIPMIIGCDLAEFNPSPYGRKADWTEDQKLAVIRERYGSNEKAIAEAFHKAYPDIDVSYASAADTMVRPATLEFARRRTIDADAPVYTYVFAYETFYKGGCLSGHGMEMNFMFHNAFQTPSMRKGEVTGRLQDEMAGAWCAFCAKGDPNAEGLPVWPAFTEKDEVSMIFGDHSHAASHPDDEFLKLTSGEGPVDPLTGKKA